nr:hypothetical protein [uncultured Pseudomonas sp.]
MADEHEAGGAMSVNGRSAPSWCLLAPLYRGIFEYVSGFRRDVGVNILVIMPLASQTPLIGGVAPYLLNGEKSMLMRRKCFIGAIYLLFLPGEACRKARENFGEIR